MPKTLTRLIGHDFTLANSGHISAAAFRQVRDYLCHHYELSLHFVEPLLADAGTALVVANKKDCPAGVSGSYAKRVASAFHKADIDISNEDKAVIGEIANRATVRLTLYGTVTQDLDWYAGKFGDEGSCFWSDREVARRIIRHNGGGAVTLYTDPDKQTGAGRCWILPVANLGYVIFNAYGAAALEAIASGMADAFGTGVPYPITLTESGVWRGDDFWINGGRAMVLPTVTRHITTLDLDLNRPRLCHRCGKWEGTVTFSERENFCDTCVTSAVTCASCGTRGYDYTDNPEGDGVLCNRCYTVIRPTCFACDQHFLPGELLTPTANYWFAPRRICPTCARRHRVTTLEPQANPVPTVSISVARAVETDQSGTEVLVTTSTDAVEDDWLNPYAVPTIRYYRPVAEPPTYLTIDDFFMDEDESESE